MKLMIMIAGALIAFGAIFLTYYQAAGGLGFEGGSFPVVAIVATAVVMILGIIFGCLFRRLSGPDRPVNLWSEFSSVIQSSSFLAALCVSPFVFLGIYALVRDAPGDPASYLLAFQNGFFCESIFRRMFKEDGMAAQAVPPKRI